MSSLMERLSKNEIKPLGLLENGTPFAFTVQYADYGSTKGHPGDAENKAKPQRGMYSLLLKVTSHSNMQKINIRFFDPVESDAPDTVEGWEQEIFAFANSVGWNKTKHGMPPAFVPGMDKQELTGWKGLSGFAIAGKEEWNGEERNNVKAFLDKDEYERRLELSNSRSM